MYKTRLYCGNILCLSGALPALYMLNMLSAEESSAQAGVVGLFIFVVLGPMSALGALLSITAVVNLTSMQKVKTAKLNTPVGIVAIALGWSAALTAGMVLGVLAVALLRFTFQPL